MKNGKCSIINSSYPFWDNSIDRFCGVVNSIMEEIKVVLFKADVPSKSGVVFPAEILRETAMHSQHLMFDEDNLELYYMEYASLEEKT